MAAKRKPTARKPQAAAKRAKHASPRAGATRQLAKAGVERKTKRYALRLYVAGMTPRSTLAVENLKQICETHLKGRFNLQIIDIFQQPIFARDGQILAAPTLIKDLPPPLRRFVGDLSDTEKVLVGLDLKTR